MGVISNLKTNFFYESSSSAIGETSSFAPPLPEELTKNLSCAEMAVLKVQSESVNVRVAAEAADYLYRIVAGNLKRFATYFDLESGMARSIYITQH